MTHRQDAFANKLVADIRATGSNILAIAGHLT